MSTRVSSNMFVLRVRTYKRVRTYRSVTCWAESKRNGLFDRERLMAVLNYTALINSFLFLRPAHNNLAVLHWNTFTRSLGEDGAPTHSPDVAAGSFVDQLLGQDLVFSIITIGSILLIISAFIGSHSIEAQIKRSSRMRSLNSGIILVVVGMGLTRRCRIPSYVCFDSNMSMAVSSVEHVLNPWSSLFHI